ncbi:MAG: DUF4869 domain-containing protein [Lachnospiraceae bacterium]|nr:DUF4869 domain-containing protein [Lachnospiraceae bacterium]
MITVYKKNALPDGAEIIKVNDVFFNKHTAEKLDERAEYIIHKIDHAKVLSKYSIASRYDGAKLNVDKLSTGCKSALNIMYNPDRIFDISECGENALEEIYSLDKGKVFCEHPMIAFNMAEVGAYEPAGIHIYKDYDELREWWNS